MSTRAILVSSDLMFISKVKEAARATHAAVTVARSVQAFQTALKEGPAGIILLDLEKAGAPLEELAPLFVTALADGWRGVSFFSHVHGDLEERAQAMGLGTVLPRSLFVRRLHDLLSESGTF